jgi:hypothetical protein
MKRRKFIAADGFNPAFEPRDGAEQVAAGLPLIVWLASYGA